MNRYRTIAVFLAAVTVATASTEDLGPDPARDILVTFANARASVIGSGAGEPYRKRKRYSIGTEARRHAADIASEYALIEVDGWPIRSLSVFCFVYRLPPDADRDAVIRRLRADARVESAQALQQFETLASAIRGYDDTYAGLQRGLDVMEIPAAHRYSRGEGVRVAIVDGRADAKHEDLEGLVTETWFIEDSNRSGNGNHGTAVASVIGAKANNARGIVGVAPEATMELYVACWAENGALEAVCDSFTLAKALDAIVADAPDVLNLSLTGPYDPLLERLLNAADQTGVIIVAARPLHAQRDNRFPASLDSVIGVGSSDAFPVASRVDLAGARPLDAVYAPAEQIMVAAPHNAYDFRSGSSLAAAHVSGVVALLLAASPHMPREAVVANLHRSQQASRTESSSINACVVLRQLDRSRECHAR